MQISHDEFKAANTRLKETVTYTELFKALKKHLQAYFNGTHGAAIVDDIEDYLAEQSSQTPDRRLTAQWLSSALAGKDYNKFIAELKAQDEDPAPQLENPDESGDSAPFSQFASRVDFDSFEEAIKQFIHERFKNNVLYSELEIWGTAITVINMLFGKTDWSNRMTFSMVYGNTTSRVKEVADKQTIYWIKEVTIRTSEGDYCEYAIVYTYQAGKESISEPSEEEVETQQLEKLTQLEMKERFAWNCKTNRPVTIFKDEYPHGDGKMVLISNK